MTRNIGAFDRAVRLFAGIVLVLLPLLAGFAADTPWLWWATLLAGVVLTATALMRSCPLYTVLGLNTCEIRQ